MSDYDSLKFIIKEQKFNTAQILIYSSNITNSHEIGQIEKNLDNIKKTTAIWESNQDYFLFKNNSILNETYLSGIFVNTTDFLDSLGKAFKLDYENFLNLLIKTNFLPLIKNRLENSYNKLNISSDRYLNLLIKIEKNLNNISNETKLYYNLTVILSALFTIFLLALIFWKFNSSYSKLIKIGIDTLKKIQKLN